jgi:hypothetical protein
MMTTEQHDRLIREEYAAWETVMDCIQDDLGVTLARFNSRGARTVVALDRWADSRATLLAHEREVRRRMERASLTGDDLRAMADWQNTGKDGRVK